ncbi:hypothetical protein MBBA_1791 [Methanoculleus bourgensis]|jgi:hypothetical protein|nr:hypothetical protein MBBA_1791 [Methanoculleus bourgensis]
MKTPYSTERKSPAPGFTRWAAWSWFTRANRYLVQRLLCIP